jgi:hypothetical protein
MDETRLRTATEHTISDQSRYHPGKARKFLVHQDNGHTSGWNVAAYNVSFILEDPTSKKHMKSEKHLIVSLLVRDSSMKTKEIYNLVPAHRHKDTSSTPEERKTM